MPVKKTIVDDLSYAKERFIVDLEKASKKNIGVAMPAEELAKAFDRLIGTKCILCAHRGTIIGSHFVESTKGIAFYSICFDCMEIHSHGDDIKKLLESNIGQVQWNH